MGFLSFFKYIAFLSLFAVSLNRGFLANRFGELLLQFKRILFACFLCLGCVYHVKLNLLFLLRILYVSINVILCLK
jgi:hypothetical protein